MSSILTNTAALNALKQLTMTNQALQQTQNQISSGLKVASASDNASYWSIATTMRSDDSSIKAVNDALGLGASAVSIAYNGTNSAITIAQSIKDKLVSAEQPGTDRKAIQAEIKQLQDQLKSTADASTFSGQNYLSVDSSAATYNATSSLISSYTRTATGVKVGTIDIDVTSSKLYDAKDQSGILDKTFAVGTGTASVATLDVSALTDSATDIAKIQDMVTGVESAVSGMTTSAANLGSAQSRITAQQSFLSSLSSSIESGVSALVDADMTQASTRLQALQVQQQLGTQALSIANQSSQSILSLFR